MKKKVTSTFFINYINTRYHAYIIYNNLSTLHLVFGKLSLRIWKLCTHIDTLTDRWQNRNNKIWILTNKEHRYTDKQRLHILYSW